VGSSQPPETALTSVALICAQGFYTCRQPGQLKGLALTLPAPGCVPPLALLPLPCSAFQQTSPAPPFSARPSLARHEHRTSLRYQRRH